MAGTRAEFYLDLASLGVIDIKYPTLLPQLRQLVGGRIAGAYGEQIVAVLRNPNQQPEVPLPSNRSRPAMAAPDSGAGPSEAIRSGPAEASRQRRKDEGEEELC